MTTEEMKKVISDYMKVDLSEVYSFEIDYHDSWDALMPLWKRLRMELLEAHETDVCANIEYYVSSVNITTAHRLMVEAIELIKK